MKITCSTCAMFLCFLATSSSAFAENRSLSHSPQASKSFYTNALPTIENDLEYRAAKGKRTAGILFVTLGTTLGTVLLGVGIFSAAASGTAEVIGSVYPGHQAYHSEGSGGSSTAIAITGAATMLLGLGAGIPLWVIGQNQIESIQNKWYFRYSPQVTFKHDGGMVGAKIPF